MNGPADKNDDFSDWDSLATELGIDSAAPAKPALVAPPAAKHVPPPTPVPPPPPVKKAEVVVERPAVFIPEPMPKIASDDTFGADLDDEKSGDDTVMEDGPEVSEDDQPTGDGTVGEAGKEGDVRKRRRRRRRKKGPGESAPVGSEEADGTEIEPPEVMAEESPAEIVGEAAAELDDEFDGDERAAPATLDAELEDNSTEPLPEWKVMAWTDLLATLYRPQDH